ncbi:MAG: CoA-transferase [Candidatus Bathyarchaeia archaeon]
MGQSSDDKVMTMKEAIKKFVNDGDTIWLGGINHHQAMAAMHEIARQKKRNLTLIGLILDASVLFAAKCVKKILLSFSNAVRYRSYENSLIKLCEDEGIHIEIEEYSNFALSLRLLAGSLGIPFIVTKTLLGTDYLKVNPNIKVIECPFTGEKLLALPALNPDVAIIHVQRSDHAGNAQKWGMIGADDIAAKAAKKIIVSCEEIVEPDVIRRDPNRTIIMGFRVNAVVEEPWGAHPWFVYGYYDVDFPFLSRYIIPPEKGDYLEIIRNYMNEWVYGVESRREYIEKYIKVYGRERLESLKIKHKISSGEVNYGYTGE